VRREKEEGDTCEKTFTTNCEAFESTVKGELGNLPQLGQCSIKKRGVGAWQKDGSVRQENPAAKRCNSRRGQAGKQVVRRERGRFKELRTPPSEQ